MADDVNLNRLAVFVALVRAGSFTAAAEQLGTTKAMVSQHLAKLEEELGVTLLVRSTRRMALTDGGTRFHEYRTEVEDQGDDDPMRLVTQVTDWRSAFEVDEDDTRTLVDAINELAARWSEVTIDWGGDPTEDEFHEDIDGVEIFARAYDQLNQYDYTLWSRETDDETLSGWITASSDNEQMRQVATALGINIRLGSQLS